MTILAPELVTGRWFNTPAPLSLAALRGTVVVLHAFQMLCPGCVAHGTPQAEKLHRMFAGNGAVAVLGLHAVFEHHAAMTEVALEAFIHEYRLTLLIAVDLLEDDGPIPQTMRRYGMRGTPTTIVIDRDGRVREHAFGQVDDLALGILVGSLIAAPVTGSVRGELVPDGCDEAGCRLTEATRP
ncbi:Peroxiredoxin [Methylobacterium sp. UNC300MFChir4.1]|uniref:peroxiredoxin family protein n=1 Tax=Methylobacterium sp. UNC300MFChir4.1 TaxID=1502747 RepID=UPI0008B34B2E|nr:TlpA disulfide reductase family protein [Methylobacterium sp. UNC300MFChir4.1]SEN22980.1 Peroxiredoxin [Methylobacterium sp. UNC300MFChir4.1]